MGGYRYLTDEDRAAILAEVEAARPAPEAIVKAAEAAHYRSVVEAKLGLHEAPDEFVAPDVADAHAEREALAAEVAAVEVAVAADVTEVKG